MSRPEAFFRFLLRHRWIVLAAHAGLFAVALAGAGRVRVDYSAEQFLVFDGLHREVYERFKGHFPREDLQVSAFLEVDGEPGPEEYRTLEALADAFRDAGLERVRWLGQAELVESTIVDGRPAARLVRLADEPEPSASRLRELLATHAGHPLLAGTLWNAGQTVFAVHGYVDPAENDDPHRRALTARLQAVVQELSAASAGRIVLNGIPVLRVTVPLAMEADIVRLLGIGFLVSFVVLLAYFQRLLLVVVCFVAVLPAMFVTLGLMGFSGRAISVLTSAMPIVVLVVAISDSIHLVVGTRRRRHEGLDVLDAVATTFASLARSCFFTSLTTALGFLGLVATGNRLVAEFGVVTALAVGTAYVVTMTLLPVLLTFARDLGPEHTAAERLCRRLVRGAEASLSWRPVWITSAFALCLGAGLVLGAGLRVEALLIDDLADDDPLVEELRWIEDAGFGVFQVNVFMEAGTQPLHAPEVLAWIEELQAFAGDDPIVIGSVGLPQVVRAFGGAGAASADTGPVRWNAEEIEGLIAVAERREPDALDDLYLPEEDVGQVLIAVRDEGSSRLSPFLGALEERIAERPVPGGSAAVTGTVKLSQVLWDELLSTFLPGVISAVVLVWLAMAWMFGSARLGALALIPNLVPLAMLLGLMRLGGFDLKPSTIIVFAIAFGIVADDTIHFLGVLARNLRLSSEVDAALRATVREVGPALIVSTVAVCSGFVVLTASRFQVLYLVGLLTTTAAVLAVAADLLGFPALLRILARRPGVRALLVGPGD